VFLPFLYLETCLAFNAFTLASSTPSLAISFCASTSALISPASLALASFALAACNPEVTLFSKLLHN
jgi:hypothetical protein